MNGYRRAGIAFILSSTVGLAGCAPKSPAAPGPAPPAPQIDPGRQFPDSARLAVTGLVREPNGPALAGVTVRAWGLHPDGRSNNYDVASTRGDGRYGISVNRSDTLSFESAGFVTKYWRAPAEMPQGGTLDLELEMKLQRALTVSVAAPLSSVLTDDDVTYHGSPEDGAGEGDYVCGPCKVIRLNRPDSSPMIVRLTWSGDLPLNLWVGDGWGVSQFHTARAGESELTVTLIGSRFLSQVLVGIDSRTSAVALGGDVRFTLSVKSQ